MISDIPPRVDISFRLAAKLAPLDHGYALFSALCRLLGDLHGAEWLAVHPLPGTPRPDGLLAVDGRRGLRLRVDPAQIPRVLPLAGKWLDIGGHAARVGVSSVFPLASASTLRARLVTIKGFLEPEPFLEALQRQLDAMGVAGRPTAGRRRVLDVANDKVVGFGVELHGLTEDGALRVQALGLGGRRRMGCGVFVPATVDEASAGREHAS
ncbi:uncharacterized protein CMC5_052700 [Chondromyces crocatus]|uniref:Type I-MYXAN CRISPR-associated protein Cas6/Cmx6 n=1 Tax=Chondromyces crocatus TaxID=52 RepID=A0A0K1EJT7_CHOCO|nr:uncharacterized protein CMC5_052700 [Chondromyces crocatus]